MEIFQINLRIDDLKIINRGLKKTMKKLLRVIKSMEKREHIQPTKRYMDLWFRAHGEEHRKLIEIYFKTKTNEIK